MSFFEMPGPHVSGALFGGLLYVGRRTLSVSPISTAIGASVVAVLLLLRQALEHGRGGNFDFINRFATGMFFGVGCIFTAEKLFLDTNTASFSNVSNYTPG